MLRTMLVVITGLALGAWPLAAQGAGGGVGAGAGAGVQAGQEGWLGVGLSCDNCSLRRSRSEPGRWTFRESPTIFWVDPNGPADRAGLRRGDTLIAIDGQQLTSEEGGRAFARVAPGQQVRITYRRGTQERQARLTAAERPESEATTATTARFRLLQEQQEQQIERQNQLRESRQAQVDQAREEMRQAANELARLNTRMRARDTLAADAMRRRLLAAESTLAALSAVPPIPPVAWTLLSPRPGGKYLPGVAAVPPAPPVAPVAPTPPTPTSPAAPAIAPEPPTPPYAFFRNSGALRYSGRLGDAVVEARARGPVNTNLNGDSEVVVTSGDLSVRVALRPRGPSYSYSYSYPTPAPIAIAAGSAFTREGDFVYGVTTYPINPGLGRSFGATSGLLVLDVVPRSHADSLGIEAGDVLLEANGHALGQSVAGLTAAPRRGTPRASPPGALSVTVMRAGERRTLRVQAPPGVPSTPRPRRP